MQTCKWLIVAWWAIYAWSPSRGADDFRPRSHDWPQFRGPRRDAVSTETGLLRRWPKGGPPLVWKATSLGHGFAAVSVSAGRILSLGERESNLVVVCLRESDGKESWVSKVGGPWKGEGPNSTPTVDGDLLYVLLPEGELVCLETATGKERWRRELAKDFAARFPGRGMAESPLVDGNRVICTPGGPKAALVAFDKLTGKTIWQAETPQGDRATYASAIAADVGDQRQYIQFLQGGVVGVAADNGRFLWRYDRPANELANCSAPIYFDQHVFAASAYSRGGGLARLIRKDANFQAEEVYFSKDMKNHHGGVVLVNGYLYGAHGGNEDVPRLVCLDFKTGEQKWSNRPAGKGSIAYADGRLYFRNEDGPMLFIEATPRGYVEHGRFAQPERQSAKAWPYPVIANGRLYLRDQHLLFCYDVKQPQ